jgi:hypothetical protein
MLRRYNNDCSLEVIVFRMNLTFAEDFGKIRNG